MAYTDQEIESIISQTLSKFQNQGIRTGTSVRWLCDTAEEAIQNAKAAQKELIKSSLEKRGRLIEAMRKVSLENAEKLARLAHEETGYGRVSDKTAKNILAAEKTPGIEDLNAQAYTGDYGLTLVEAAPYGVVGSITPSTNPTSTVINNAISMIAAGNAVVFNPHPAAKRASQETMRLLNAAIEQAGGPSALITTVKEPTLNTGKAIMESGDVSILSVTGGEAVVAVAMRSGKKVIAAGPGNPPVIVDDTANIEKAAADIVNGASFDNNVVCIAEKEVFAFSGIVDELVAQMQKNGACLVSGDDAQKIVDKVLLKKDDGYVINRDYVGKDASVILRDSGVGFSGDPRLVIARVDKNHPFVRTEMLMPVLGICTVETIDEAVNEAICAEQGRQHSAMIHSTNIKNLSYAATALNTTVFVKNAPSYAGLGFQAEGYTTLTIATPTGEGLTSAKSFTRARRCVLHGDFRIV
jgi:acyl-CoA reductase-like NAD-dependent aldehyde dehydrogenase